MRRAVMLALAVATALTVSAGGCEPEYNDPGVAKGMVDRCYYEGASGRVYSHVIVTADVGRDERDRFDVQIRAIGRDTNATSYATGRTGVLGMGDRFDVLLITDKVPSDEYKCTILRIDHTWTINN